MKSRIIIKKLALRGDNKKDAVLDFICGLNVVSGASDTGKSFAFDCINFAFGSTTIPKLPPEAKGYSQVFLEIEDYKNDIVTIQRNFDDSSSAYWIYSSFENINSDTQFEKISAESKGKKNLSEKILAICKCSYSNIIKKIGTGETKRFTFRDFVPLIMVNEERITQKYSPVHRVSPRGSTFATGEWTAFQTILTGQDYPKVEKKSSGEITKAHITGQINELEILCHDLKIEIENYKSMLSQKTFNFVEETIAELQKVIDEKKDYISIREEEHNRLTNELREMGYKRQRIEDNIIKFELLMNNYKSDFDRIDFIAESYSITDQLLNIECPICHSIKTEEPYHQKELYYKAFTAEKEKIELLMKELGSTIESAQNEQKEIDLQLPKLNQMIDDVTADINNALKPIMDVQIKEIEKLLYEKEMWNKLFECDTKLKQYEDRIADLEVSREEISKSKKVELKEIPEESLNKLIDIIKKMLIGWNFIKNETKITFDKTSKDVVIDEKNKEIYGKGARAIINSAFLIGNMNYCYNSKLPHPGIVILDTPLTTFKEKDKVAGLKDESIGKDIKMAVYRQLSETHKEYQIIIFENEEPASDIISNINYIHFTGNANVGRKGFIPE
ncbi:hypothetical protein [Lacrimispora sp.]|uniref:hypothetical protein n=1 Tax=Lacrimispora sp. TaxID=2719234 RepID=UPI0029E2E740|nr:hypothetical protein [Lacrimispora sp.]